ncbi:hypothetical protein F4776DRAFT_674851 [Hypoxylon sp. NC0597]|nr:hypothetical protein F4776DRAFT_674851 [Hypoxylon sp. NC0597]
MELKQSAELPVMPGSVIELINMLDRGDSMENIYHALRRSDMIEGIADHSCFEGKELMVLLHSMSRELLRSVLMKTLGPDLYDKDFSSKELWGRVLGNDGPGAYIVFIFIRGRKGRFLCVREIKELIRLLQLYADAVDIHQAYKVQDQYGSSQLTPDGKEAIRVAMTIDDAERTEKHYPRHLDDSDYERFQPRFISSTNMKGLDRGQNVKASENINQLIKMLRKRCLPGVDEEVFQMQSPLLVGKSGDIIRGASDHLQGQSLSKTPKVWGLLLSCFKVMGLPYETRFATLFRAWKDADQINHAEILGTTLAGSLLSVDGCNAKQPGTRGGEDRTDDFGYANSKQHVFAGVSWFRENLRKSVDDREINREAERRLQDKVAEMKENSRKLKEMKARVDQGLARLKKAKASYERTKAEAEKQLESL